MAGGAQRAGTAAEYPLSAGRPLAGADAETGGDGRHSGGHHPAGVARLATRLPVGWPQLAAVSAPIGAGRHPRRRYGAGKNGADPHPYLGRKRGGAAHPAGTGGRADQPDAQLEGGGLPLHPRPLGAGVARPESRRPFRQDRRLRSGADHLPATLPRSAGDHGAPLPSADSGRGAAGQEPPFQGGADGAYHQGQPPPLPHRHPAGEPSRRAVDPVRFSDAGLPLQPAHLHQGLSPPDRGGGDGEPPAPAQPAHPPLHAAPRQARCGSRAPAENRDRPLRGDGGGAATALRKRAPLHGEKGARFGRRHRTGAQPTDRARRPAQDAAGLLRPPAAQNGERGQQHPLGQARPAARHATGDGQRGAAHPALLPVHPDAEADRAGLRRDGDPLHQADRQHPRSRHPDRGVPAGQGAALSHQPEGGGNGAQPDRRRHRHPLRPVVEPGGRGSGHRPRPPHRTGQVGLCL